MLLQAINQEPNNFIAFVKENNSNNQSVQSCPDLCGHSQQNIRWEYESDIFICNGSIAEAIYFECHFLFSEWPVLAPDACSLGDTVWAHPQHLG